MRRVTILFLFLLVFTSGCARKKEKDKIIFLPSPAVSVQSARVFDPKLPGSTPINIQYQVNPAFFSFEATVKVQDITSGAEVRRLVDGETIIGGIDAAIAWDGKNDGGEFVDTGDYRIVVEAVNPILSNASSEEIVHIVRLGIAGIQFVDNGPGGSEYQIMYHIRNTTKYAYYAIPDNMPEWSIGAESGDVADMDTNDGAARQLPLPWTNLNNPPQDATDTAGVEDDNYNLPVCYKRGSMPKFMATLGSGAASNVAPGMALGCNYPQTGLPVRIVAANATPEAAGANEDISPAGTVSFVCDSALPDAVKKNTLNLIFTFEYEDGGVWHRIPGEITTTHTVYTIHDKPMLTSNPSPTTPYLPWVRILDFVCDWVNGSATADEITSIITNEANTFFGLQYDTVMGASHYTTISYVFEMSDFIEDYDGGTFTTINCSDCACLASTLANTVGVDHQYQILGAGTGAIPLNYMIPIGRAWAIPFSGYFSYHAVVTKDNGVTVSDACCTLDDDGDAGPGSNPSIHTPLLPANLDYNTYNSLLSWDPSQYGTAGFGRCGQH